MCNYPCPASDTAKRKAHLTNPKPWLSKARGHLSGLWLQEGQWKGIVTCGGTGQRCSSPIYTSLRLTLVAHTPSYSIYGTVHKGHCTQSQTRCAWIWEEKEETWVVFPRRERTQEWTGSSLETCRYYRARGVTWSKTVDSDSDSESVQLITLHTFLFLYLWRQFCALVRRLQNSMISRLEDTDHRGGLAKCSGILPD